jgi:cytochrome c oxidase assembly protein subunit 15
MNSATPLYNLSPALSVAFIGALLALAPVLWVLLRHRGQGGAGRMHALTLVTLFLTFDLVLFGAFTRLTDSGLGCPDWPGCYGSTSPLGAHAEIRQAQSVMPTGPVTLPKAWVEMIHRYLATGVGALIVVLLVAHVLWLLVPVLRRRRGASSQRPSILWPMATLAWVCLQGAFGALTVTMKLYPAIVTLHLLGGLGLLMLLAAQSQAYESRPLAVSHALRIGIYAVALLMLTQVLLGGWVSTNYAVLACSDFPTCQGNWWPDMDFANGFALRRPLGAAADGSWLPFAALTAIHYTHRLMAYAVLVALLALAWALRNQGTDAHRRWARVFGGIALWQLATGVSNVVFGWPLLTAVAHTGGAAALVVSLTVLIMRTRNIAPAAPKKAWASSNGTAHLAA